MIKIGITGGIGSGKSAVCEIWQSLGAYIINADDIAKILMAESAQIRQEIIKAFGEKSYHSDGSLNRKFLAHQAFERDRVKELNAIVHPYIPKQVELLMQDAEDRGVGMSVYEAALLLQNLRPDNLDYVVLVLADEEERIKRVQQRDGISREQVTERINKQQDFGELKHLADVIIKNDGTFKELQQKAERLYYKFLNV
jgi:dephospho-CoA kinase